MPASDCGRACRLGGPAHAGARTLAFALALLAAGTLIVATALADLGTVRQLPKTFRDKPALGNSRAGRPIVVGRDMVPGQKVRGEVRVRNRGARTSALYVAPRRSRDTLGVGDAKLSTKLLLAIRRVDRRGRLHTVWKGYLDSMGRVRVAVLRPGAVRRYRFVVRFRVHPPARGWFDDNDFRESSFTTDFVWRLVPLK